MIWHVELSCHLGLGISALGSVLWIDSKAATVVTKVAEWAASHSPQSIFPNRYGAAMPIADPTGINAEIPFFETLTTEKSATVQLFGVFCSFKVSRNRQVASFRNSVSFIQLEVWWGEIFKWQRQQTTNGVGGKPDKEVGCVGTLLVRAKRERSIPTTINKDNYCHKFQLESWPETPHNNDLSW